MKLSSLELMRFYSRELVRELGFLENPYERYGFSFAHIHLLLECEKYGAIEQQALAKNLRVNKSYISRLVKSLSEKQMLQIINNPLDKRSKPLILSALGYEKVKEIHEASNQQVLAALQFLNEEEQEKIIEGLKLYSQAHKKARKLKDIKIRPLKIEDNQNLCILIKSVLTEFGANKPGFAYTDAETHAMFEAYQESGKKYFVAERDHQLLGGAGFAPLIGSDSSVCELRKMYLVPAARGLGLGDELLRIVEQEASQLYQSMYLETMAQMTQAIALYQRNGFEFLSERMGDTGHFSCDILMQKTLKNEQKV